MLKKMLFLSLLIVFSFSLALAEDFTITLYDSYGDGWNGGMLDLTVAGTLVLDDATIETGDEASFTFGVNEGDEVVIVYTEGGWAYENTYVLTNNVGTDFYTSPNPPEASYTFTAAIGSTDTGSLAGTVVQAETREPIEGATITISSFTATTAADGTYQIDDILVGNYDVTCSAYMYFIVTENTDIVVGETTTVDFALEELMGDFIDNAIEIELVENAFTHAGTNTVYNNNYPYGYGNDLVFHLTLGSASIVDASLELAEYDTKLAVYYDTETLLDADNAIYSNDDYNFDREAAITIEDKESRDRSLQSALFDMELAAGGYWVLVDGYSPSSLGNYQLDMFVEGSATTVDYEIQLLDSYGDGWNGGMLDLTVAGVVILDDVTIETGGEAIFTFAVTEGDEVVIDYTEGGWSYENSYVLYNELAVAFYTSPAPPEASYSFIAGATTEAPAVFFSEYIEGSSNNKAIEIYNGTDDEIALDEYRINQSSNGGDWEYIHTFPVGAVLAAGEVWVIAADQLDSAYYPEALCDEFLAYPSVVHYNGNDARALECLLDGEWSIIDVIGVPTEDIDWAVAGVDPGTKNHTLVRKDAITAGNTDWAASAGTNADDSEWIVYDQNTFDYLGWHLIQPAYIGGVVTLDGFGDVMDVEITIGEITVSPNADGFYIVDLEPGTYEVVAFMSGYDEITTPDVVCVVGETSEVNFALTVIPETLWPPVNLSATIAGSDVNLAWTAPTQYGWNGYYDGPSALTWAAPERATFYDVTDFGFSYPMEISKLSHGFYQHGSYPWGDDTTFTFKIYDTDGATLIYESDAITALVQWDDTVLELATPITVTDNFWVAIVPVGASGFPSSLFDADTEDLHGYIGEAGAWTPYADWATSAYIVGEEGRSVELALNNKKSTSMTTTRNAFNQFDSITITDAYAPATRDLVSFNIFRDGAQINEAPVYTTSYADVAVAEGEHTYYATAIWNFGESAPSNEATVVLAFGTLSGTVTNVNSGAAVVGAVISAGTYAATTLDDGTYLIENMLIGTYEVACSAAGYEAIDPESAEITDGENTVVDFALTPSPGDIFFLDDFESADANWVLEGTWGLSDEGAHSPTHCLTESPGALYGANLDIAATLATPWDLSGVFGATLSFWYQSDIETAFDYMYLEITSNGTDWINLATYDEEDGEWQEEEISISGFVGAGFETVSLRFRFESDGGYETVGMLIDDVMVTTSSDDLDPPFIIHAGPEFYEGTDVDYEFTAELVDPSGVANAQAVYTIDEGDEFSVEATQGEGNTWNFVIPAQDAGSQIDYKIVATDASETNNTGEIAGFVYIAGYHFISDNGVVDFYTVINEDISAAVKVVNPAGTLVDLAYALIRNYTDQSGQDNDNFMFHVWADDAGLPGADMITPFEVVPEASYDNTSPMTRVDLRSYATELNDIDTDFFIGFSVETGDPNAKVHCTITQPAGWNQSYFQQDGIWGQATDTDYHFRAVASLATTEFATINGNVTYDGAAVVGATVSAGTYSTATDDAGDYELFVNPGTYTLTVTADGYEIFTEEVTVADGDVATIDAVLIPAFWAPTNLVYTINGNNVVLQWDEPAPAVGEEFFEGFEDEFPPAGWIKLNPDGGTGWDQVAAGTAPLPGWNGGEAFAAPDGGDYMAFATWNTGGGTSNDQWLVSPQIDVGDGSVLSFNMVCWYAASYSDHVDILISTTSQDDPDAFDTVVASIDYEAGASEEWAVFNYTLTDYVAAGSQVYIAICEVVADNYNDGAFIAIDNFSVGAAAATMPADFVNTRPAYGSKDEAYEVTPLAPTYDHATRELSGYNIYRNGDLIGSTGITPRFYVDTNVPPQPEYWVTATYIDPDGESGASNIVYPDVASPGTEVPVVTALAGNYPNPFNPSTKISFSLKEAGHVTIDIYNIRGQKIKTLVNENMEAANHEAIWNATDDNDKSVSSGIYFYRMQTNGYNSTKKMMLLK